MKNEKIETGMQACVRLGLTPEKESYSGDEFEKLGIPMIVACSCCQMTMSVLSPSVRIVNDTDVFCIDCLGIREE